MKTWKIYKHTLLVDCEHTGWSYIGLTCQDVKDRWSNGKGYCNGNQKVFEAAIKNMAEIILVMKYLKIILIL